MLNISLVKHIRTNKDTWRYQIKKFISHHVGHTLSKSNFLQEPRSKRLDDEELEKYIGEYSFQLKAKKW